MENVEMINKSRNYMFYILLGLMAIYLIFGHIKGAQQTEMQKQDYIQFRESVKHMESSNYEAAAPILKGLLNKYKDSYVVIWTYAQCLMYLGDHQEAVNYFQKAQEERPFLLESQLFTLQFGEAYLKHGDFAKSQAYLQKSKELGSDSELKAKAEQLLQEINRRG